MLSRRLGTVSEVEEDGDGVQVVWTEHGPAFNFIELTGALRAGDKVVLNRTAVDLGLGTGGRDFVMAAVDSAESATSPARREDGHVIKLRYTPLQHARKHLEEMPEHSGVWSRSLDGFPVVAAELHSQIAPICAVAAAHDLHCVYIMTPGAALPLQISKLVVELKAALMLRSDVITVSQAFGGDFEAVTLHNALLAAKHIFGADLAVVCQGPGNTGTETKYGFSGIEQSSNLDIAASLGGLPIACVRASSGDQRERHQGISHHTLTVLEAVRSRCIVPLPYELTAPAAWGERHDVRYADRVEGASKLLRERSVSVTTMGRSIEQDPLFFHSAAAAGIIATELASKPAR